MYETDVWLKDTIFNELIPKWEEEGVGATRGSVTFVPNITFRSSKISSGPYETTYFTAEVTNMPDVLVLNSVESDSDEDEHTEQFISDLVSSDDVLGMPHIRNLLGSFLISTWAWMSLSCDDKTALEPAFKSETPRSHPLFVGPVDVEGADWLLGGVRLDGGVFKRDATQPTVTVSDRNYIDAVVDRAPVAEGLWEVTVGSTTYTGIRLTGTMPDG